MFRTATMITLAASFAAAEWEMTNVQGVTTMLSVDGLKSDSDTFYGAAGVNGRGSGLLESHDGGDHYKVDVPQGGFMDLGVAVSDDGETFAMVGMGCYLRKSGESDFSRIPNTNGYSQNIVATETGFGSAGSFSQKAADGTIANVNGVLVSSDMGSSWAMFDIGANVTEGFYARYGAFPTADTWYVSTGTWPMDDVTVHEDVKNKPISRHIARDGQLRTSSASADEGNGYVGAVFKTTDGGATFNEVLNTHGQYYFNAIDCFDANNCIAAAEGTGSVGYHTSDGGNTWDTIVDEETSGSGSSMMAASMLSATEFWFGGGMPGKVGYFYHSVDGESVTKESLEGAYAAGMTFRSGQGYAAVMGRQTCGVAKLV